jgi:type IV pilus assembly protein PilP
MVRQAVLAVGLAVALGASAGAQAPAAAPARGAQPPQAAPPAGAPPAPAEPPPAEAYTYKPEGRRDPFISLIGTGAQPHLASRPGEGAAGLSVAEVSVRGTVLSHGEYVAMVQGPENKTYLVHQGDRLLDGTIKTITSEGLVIVQEVNDPLSLVPTREVRKLLRSYDEAKE